MLNWVNPLNAHTIGLMTRLGFRVEPNRCPDELAGSAAPSLLGMLERS
jgi:hypothetical protein